MGHGSFHTLKPALRRAAGVAVLLSLMGVAPWLYQRVQRDSAAGRYLEAGAAAADRRDAAGAESAWREATRIAPDNPNGFRALGTLYLAQGRFADARVALNRVASLQPGEPHALCEVAEAELRVGTVPMIDAAAEDGARAAALEPRCIRAQTVAGNACAARGDLKKGVGYLQAAYALNRSDVPLALHLVRLLLEAQRRDEAAQLAESLTRRYPGYGQAYSLLGVVYQLYPPGSPQARQTRPTLDRALRLEPTNALAHAQMGQVLLREGEALQAKRHLLAARFLNPSRTATLFALSRAHYAAGEPREALRLQREFQRRSGLENELAALQKRAALDPGNRKLLARMASLAAALGDRTRAAHYARQAGTAPAGAVSGAHR